ncbi:MAG: hypothetical protein ACRC1T_03850 [Clostridium chrysemydis]|uniref:hypothetical protein n=1 Tax=Clostridium chrysemydis TaxID=2665504 RepID=UPI003F31A197
MKNTKLNKKALFLVLCLSIFSFGLVGCETSGITVDTVKESIDKLPNPAYLTENQKSEVDKVNEDFEKLSKEDQDKVSNKEKLLVSLATLKAYGETKESVDNDFKIADEFNKKLENVTDKNKDALKKEYENLTPAQKTLIVKDINNL